MAKSPTILGLEELFAPLDNTWINKNSLVINYARNCELAVGGSIAMAISNKKPHKVPNDFDFFTDKNDNALNFLTKIITWLAQRPKTNYKVLVNNKTKFTLPGVSHHIRILVPFWKPICIMTLESPIRVFHFKGGLQVQYFDDVVAAAKQATDIDSKDRLPFDVEAARADIRNRYVANGTYDVNYQPPVTGVLRTGNNNILVGSFVRTIRQEVTEPTTYPDIVEASRPSNGTRTRVGTYIPDQTTRDLSDVLSHFESHGIIPGGTLADSNPYTCSYSGIERTGNSLCREVPADEEVAAPTPRVHATFRPTRASNLRRRLSRQLQETEIANCNS